MIRIHDDDLRALLVDTESDRAERKQSVTDGEKIAQAICAFANDLPSHGQPGVLFVNATDDGRCANKPIDDKALLTLSDMRSNGNILPIPTMSVEKRVLDGNEFGVVTVMPADAPPVRYKGTCWVRVGPRRAIASEQEERILREKRRSKDLSFDLRPVYSSKVDDLQKNLFEDEYLPSAFSPEVLEANGRTYTEKLSALRMVQSTEEPVPTVVGLLVLSPSVRDFLPGAYVQFLRIDGSELADPVIDSSEIDGPLGQMLRMLDEKLRSHVRVAVDLTSGPTEKRFPDYPIAALEQLSRNAVMHRSYEGTNAPIRITWFNDRIEITNPGGPFGTVTKQNWAKPGVADYRNPAVAEAMKTLGFVQRFGVGIATAERALAVNGNPKLVWQVEDTYVGVTIGRRS